MNNWFIFLKRLVNKWVNKTLIVFGVLSFFCLSFSLAAKENPKTNGKYEFNIPAQPLGKSLNTLSDIAEISFLFPYDLVENKNSNAVQGYYNVQQALNLLLKGSNLEGELSNKSVFLIKPLLLEKSQINIIVNEQGQRKQSLLESIFSFIFTSTSETEERGKSESENIKQEMEIIEIKGIKGSLEASVHVKRYADTVIDVITAEDIGQFSDDSIAGAIQRIPGVQIETDDAGTDGDRVSIRGLGPEFVNSTINGRRLLSSGNEAKSMRKMNFNIFPPNVLSGVNVAKGQTAVRPEGGLAGQVDLQTLKPLEIEKLENKNTFTSLSVRGSKNDIDNETGFRISVLTAWRNDDKNLAGYVSLVTSEERNARDQLHFGLVNDPVSLNIDENGDGVQDSTIDGVLVPIRLVMAPIREDTERTAFTVGIEYRANDDIDINWDLMYSNYNNKSHRIQNQTIIGPAWANTLFDMSDSANPALIINDDTLLRYADFTRSSGGGPIRNFTSSMRFNNDTKNFISGINVNWLTSTHLITNFDVYISTVDYSQDLRFPTMNKSLDKSQFIYDGTGRLPNITAPDITDVDGYAYSNTLIREVDLVGDNVGLTLKFDYDLDANSVFSSINFGSHYDKTKLDVRRSDADRITGFGSDIMESSVTGQVIPDNFFSSDNYSPARWLILDYDAAATVDPRINNTSWDELGVNRLESYVMTERIFAVFGQLNIDSEVNDMSITGNIGVRAVLTDNQSTAEQRVNGENSPINVDNDYWTVLPSFNLNIALNEAMALRFGLSKSLSRPDYQQLAPINTINTEDEQGTGNAIIGNPNLDAMTSINYDITFEWYNLVDSAFVFSVFYKDVSDFIFSTSQSGVSLPGYEGVFDVITYSNFSDGTAKGYEISLYQPLGKLLPVLEGFGFSTNYTFVDSEFDDDVGDDGLGFPGSSQDNFNFIAFYETDFIAVRLAYVYRSEFLRSLAGVGSQTHSIRFTDTQEKLDLSVSVKPMENLSIKFTANNITDDKRRDMQENGVLLATWDRGRTYSLEASYSF